MAEDYGLGRLWAPDLRDEAYPLRAAIPLGVPLPRYRYHMFFFPRDQGNTSACTGYSGVHLLDCAPVMVKTPPDPWWLYREAQRVDEFEGEEPQMQGSSVRAIAKVLQREGYIGEYRWARTVLDVRDYILLAGPVILGTIWTQGMFSPDATGRVHPTGGIAGGHAYLAMGYSQSTRLFRCVNSWGTRWNGRHNGRFWLHEDDLAKLLSQGGEALAATEIAR